MLSDMIKSSMVTLNLRAIDHGSLLTREAKKCQEVFNREKDRCHVCGFRIPGYMEIDHLKGHRPCPASDMSCICQFCHNIKHPIWSAARKRIVPVYAPEFTQEDLHRLAWTVLAWRDGEGDLPVSIADIPALMASRHEKIKDILGCMDAESLFEAALGLPRLLGDNVAAETLMKIDQFLRFWPSELMPDHESLPKGARLSNWTIGGFRVVADDVAAAIRQTYATDFEKVHDAALKVMEE
jgi:hypothetical protein